MDFLYGDGSAFKPSIPSIPIPILYIYYYYIERIERVMVLKGGSKIFDLVCGELIFKPSKVSREYSLLGIATTTGRS